jgi:hypothetical protein
LLSDPSVCHACQVQVFEKMAAVEVAASAGGNAAELCGVVAATYDDFSREGFEHPEAKLGFSQGNRRETSSKSQIAARGDKAHARFTS